MIPDFQTIMLPLLKLFQDEKERTSRKCVNRWLLTSVLLRRSKAKGYRQGNNPCITTG